jgi:hypothetical protein
MITKLEVYLALAAFLVLLGGGGFLYVRHLQDDLKDTQDKLATASQQATVNQGGAQINDRRAANVAHVATKSQEGRDAVQNAPDLDAALAQYGAAVDGVRAAGHAPVDPPH